jgi:hypothetical protein
MMQVASSFVVILAQCHLDASCLTLPCASICAIAVSCINDTVTDAAAARSAACIFCAVLWLCDVAGTFP